MIKQKIQSSSETGAKKPADKQPQHPRDSIESESKASKGQDGKMVGPLDQYINRGPPSQTSPRASEQSREVGNGQCKIPSNPSNAIVLSDSEEDGEKVHKQSSQGEEPAAKAQSVEVTVLSSQSTPQEASSEEPPPKEEKKAKSEPKKTKKSVSKAKLRKKPVPKSEKELELKREQKKKLKEEQGKAKEEKRRAIEQARKEAREQKEREKQERKQKREEEQKQKRKREEEEREKKIQQKKQVQNAKNNLANKLKQFAKTQQEGIIISPQYSDEQGNIKYPVADQLLEKFPHVSIRGQKGTLSKRPEPSDLGFVLPMTFSLWINLSNFLDFLQLESFSLEAFHEALAFETEDDVPLLSEIIKVMLHRIIDWLQEHCDQAGSQDFFDDKDRGRFSLLKNFFKEVARLKSENESQNKGRSHYQQPFECKVMDVIWPELLRWTMTSELFEQFKDQNTADIAFTLKNLQNPREFMRLSYHYKLLSVVYLLKIMMSRGQFRTHLNEILLEKSELVQAKQKKQKEQKELAQAVQELMNQIKNKNTQIRQMEKQLDQKTLVFHDNKEEEEESQEKESGDPSSKSSKLEATELVLDRQESIKVRRQLSHLENEVQRLIRRKNDQERRMANLVNSVNSIDARLNGIKMRQTPLCTDHQGRRYWYFEHDSSRLYVQGPSAQEIGFYYKSSQFHELVRSYDECGIKQRRVLEELRRVAGLLDMQDDDGSTPMKGQERLIEKQVAGQAIEDEEEDKKEEVAKMLDFEENKEEKNGLEQEKKPQIAKEEEKESKREEKTRSDYLTEALQYKIEDDESSGTIKYYTRRGGEGHAQREFCSVFTFDKLKEYIQDMELRFSQAINSFLASKWGAQGERIQWVRQYLYSRGKDYLKPLLFMKWQCCCENQIRKSKLLLHVINDMLESLREIVRHLLKLAKLWSSSFTRPNRGMWSEYVTDEASQRLPALVFAVNVLDCLINNFIGREQTKYLQLHPEENRRQKSSLEFDQFSYFSRGIGNGGHDKVGDSFIVKVPGMDGVENVGGYKMRNRSATRRAIKKVVQKEQINWEDECLICGDGGEVICCEECPTVVHKTCVGLKVGQSEWQEAPNCWHCDDCIYAATMRNKTRGATGRLVIEDSDQE